MCTRTMNYWEAIFRYGYVLPVTQHYKQRTVREEPLKSIHSLWKLQTIFATASSHCVLLKINTFKAVEK